jgi:hypothetical protein
VIAASGCVACAGRWMEVGEPGRIRPSAAGPRRDYRVLLRNDSTVLLLDAVVRNDSIAELPAEQASLKRVAPPRAVALDDVVTLEQWQPAGERIAGGTGLAILAIVAGVLTFAAIALSGGGS